LKFGALQKSCKHVVRPFGPEDAVTASGVMLSWATCTATGRCYHALRRALAGIPCDRDCCPNGQPCGIGCSPGQAWPQPLFVVRGILPIMALSERTCRVAPCPLCRFSHCSARPPPLNPPTQLCSRSRGVTCRVARSRCRVHMAAQAPPKGSTRALNNVTLALARAIVSSCCHALSGLSWVTSAGATPYDVAVAMRGSPFPFIITNSKLPSPIPHVSEKQRKLARRSVLVGSSSGLSTANFGFCSRRPRAPP